MADDKGTLEFKITHVATGVEVVLNAFALTEYEDSVSAKYSSTEVFGRMDPITTYQSTTRKIVIGLKVSDAGKDIQRQISKIMSMQYPTYLASPNTVSTNNLTIARPPLVRVKFFSMLPDAGILAAMDGFSFTPASGFTAVDSPIVRFGDTESGITQNANEIKFKDASMRFNLTVLHEKAVGWKDEGVLNDITRWLGEPNFGPGSLY